MALTTDRENENEIMAEINMTPLIDIMLVLLIIFMVTSSISLESGVDIDLPQTKSKTKKQEEAVLVSLNSQGKLSVQGKSVEASELKNAIKVALEEEKTKLVILEGDKNASLGRAVNIMDIAKEAGADRFLIAAEAE